MDFKLGFLDLGSGDFKIQELEEGRNRTECRIEALRDERMLVSLDGRQLIEFDLAT